MQGLQLPLPGQKNSSPAIDTRIILVGYLLTPRSFELTDDAYLKLQGRSARAGARIFSTETDVGSATNPFRSGLWRALRLLVCSNCQPKRMPLTMMNFDDFLHQALHPCNCGAKSSISGLVLANLDHLSSDSLRSASIIMELARLGKHVIADEGICLSCCHPATKKLLGGAR